MNLLILCPGKIPKSVNDIRCFTDVINFYLPPAIASVSNATVLKIPFDDGENLKNIFKTVNLDGYDAIITLGLRYFSKIPKSTAEILRLRFNGLICQVHDGSRLNYDPVDITFTFKNDDLRMAVNAGWYQRHRKNNVYMGWAADPELNFPNQSSTDLRILVDHTNYGDNDTDETKKILLEIKRFVESNIWKKKYQTVSIRRFDSCKVVDVDLDNLSYEKYDRNKSMPISEISKEHSAAHIFCVTHPESVGLVVLETALAGALIVTPKEFIPTDRLQTVRHYEWENNINWDYVLDNIDIELSRKVASENTWKNMAQNIVNAIEQRNNNVD